jgi:hypothetical protein
VFEVWVSWPRRRLANWSRLLLLPLLLLLLLLLQRRTQIWEEVEEPP